MEGQILAQRQALSGIASSATSVIGNIGDAASSAASAVSSAILTSKTSSTSASTTSSASSASNTSNTSSTSSSTASSTSSSSSPTSSVSASETLSTALSSSSSDSAASSLPSVSESVYETTSDGVIHTVTTFASAAEESATGSSSSAATAQTGVTHKSFLQNKSLSGFVFALCGIVGLVLILLVVTFTLRRRRKNKLLNEAISFDPQGSAYHPDRDMEEKLTHQRAVNSIGGSVSGTHENGSSTGHGMYMPPAAHGYYDAGYSGQTGNAYTYATYAPTRSEARNPSYDHLGVTHNMGSLAFENRSMSPPRSQVPAMGPPSNNFGQNYAYGTAQ
ncbi:uncharacterized protein ARMOST_05398 [Armillaria ostoyae]|uniref:Mid2 domain-containing protein n=1 Tax=Armillaria ostoyae TaxID=47428 RepID=A0A284R030_ARMOS|nr:uncharacterized protein ARMOST_05398 [Armillaria ostoyae]